MKILFSSVAAILLAISSFLAVNAQSADRIWLSNDTVSLTTGEVLTVSVIALSTTPIQGFTFQILYDPACLQSLDASSPITGMNGLSMPQVEGLVDASFASTTANPANCILAKVRFRALEKCQTSVQLESAALAIRDTTGFAVPLPSVNVQTESINIAIDGSAAKPIPNLAPAGSLSLAAEPTVPSGPNSAHSSQMLGWSVVFISLGAIIFSVAKYIQSGRSSDPNGSPSRKSAALRMKTGSQSGTAFVLNKFPYKIGSGENNNICINDPLIMTTHAVIYHSNQKYFLVDVAQRGSTSVNGAVVRQEATALKAGDTLRLGRHIFFEFEI